MAKLSSAGGHRVTLKGGRHVFIGGGGKAPKRGRVAAYLKRHGLSGMKTHGKGARVDLFKVPGRSGLSHGFYLAERPLTPAMVRRFQELVRAGRIKGMKLADGTVEMKARCSAGEKALVSKLKGERGITNPYALAKWMKRRKKTTVLVEMASAMSTGRWITYHGRRIFIGPGLRGWGGKKKGSSGAGRGIRRSPLGARAFARRYGHPMS